MTSSSSQREHHPTHPTLLSEVQSPSAASLPARPSTSSLLPPVRPPSWRVDLSMVMFGLCGAVSLAAAWMVRAAGARVYIPSPALLSLWHAAAPLLMVAALVLGFNAGAPRLSRWLAALTVATYATQLALQRFQLLLPPALDIQIWYGVLTLGAAVGWGVRRLCRGSGSAAV
jgi:hypothetical protein